MTSLLAVRKEDLKGCIKSIAEKASYLTGFFRTSDSYTIDNDLDSLIKAIEAGDSLSISKRGTWYKNPWIVRIFRKILLKDETISATNQLVRYLEKPYLIKGEDIQGYAQPKKILNKDQIQRLVDGVKKSLNSRLRQEDLNLSEIEKDISLLKNSSTVSEADIINYKMESYDKENFPAKAALANLQRAQLSNFYLGIPQKNIHETEVDPEKLAQIENLLKKWQDKTFPYINFLEEPYREGTLLKLKRCCQYSEFFATSLDNSILLDIFFHAVFRNMPQDYADAVDIFVQMPLVQKSLHWSYIDTRIQRIRNNGLKFEEYEDKKTGKIIKDVKLLISGKYQSITDKNMKLDLSTEAEKVDMTVQGLFKKFKHGLDKGFIEYEYLQDLGITNFDSRCRNIDLTDPDWWKKIPIVERLTRDEISERYKTDFKEGHSLFVLRASRKYPDLHAQDTHASIDILIPLEDGTFNCITAGKFATKFPETKGLKGIVEQLKTVLTVQPAEIVIIDPNKFYTGREHIYFPFPPMTEDQFKTCMEKIRKDMIRCRENKEYFQSQGPNCAKWAENLIKEVFPKFTLNLFDTHYTEITIPPFIAPALKLGNVLRIVLLTLMGAWWATEFKTDDGKTQKVRLIWDRDWLKGILRVPARIFMKDRSNAIRQAIRDLSKS